METKGPWKLLTPGKLTELDEHSWETQIDQEKLDEITLSMIHRGWYGPPLLTVGDSHGVVDGRHRALAAQKSKTIVPVVNVSEEEFDTEVRRWPVRSLEDIAKAILGRKTKT